MHAAQKVRKKQSAARPRYFVAVLTRLTLLCRVAAMSVSRRVAEEMDVELGQQVRCAPISTGLSRV
jgi:hypothetical protein